MMLSVALLLALAAALYASIRANGAWRQRARSSEKQIEQNREAHEIKNDVMRDPAFRERVRRYFDGQP